MAKRQFANNAAGKLNAGITNVATTLTLQAAQGALFPATATGKFFMASLIKATGEIEVIKVTQRTGDVFDTIVRAQEGTTSLAFSSGDRVELRVTKGTLDAFVQDPAIASVGGNETLDYDKFNTTRIYTAAAAITLPPSTAVNIGDYIDFKSLTTGHVRFVPDGADTIDGVAAIWSVPSFTDGRIAKSATGQWVLVRKPSVEIGMVEFWPVASANPPRGYVFADGVALNRTTFSGLFSVYGTTHGAGDGSTTFGNADMRGRAAFGKDDMGGVAASRLTIFNGAVVGSAGGAQTVTLSTAQLPPHSHGVTDPTHNHGHSDPGHAHGVTDPAHSHSGGFSASQNNTSGTVPPFAGTNVNTGLSFTGISIQGATTGVTNQAAATGISIQNTGSGSAVATVPPAFVGQWIVKT